MASAPVYHLQAFVFDCDFLEGKQEGAEFIAKWCE